MTGKVAAFTGGLAIFAGLLLTFAGVPNAPTMATLGVGVWLGSVMGDA